MRSFAPKLNPSQKPASADAARPKLAMRGSRERAALHFERSSGHQAAQPEPTARSSPTASTYLSYDFARIPLHPPAHAEQTTVAISEPSDEYEQQADRLADQVMFGTRPIDSSGRHAGSETTDPIAASVDFSSRGENTLEPEDRRFFESRFHHNFADVKICSDREANRSARALHARAYTIGNTVASPQANTGLARPKAGTCLPTSSLT